MYFIHNQCLLIHLPPRSSNLFCTVSELPELLCIGPLYEQPQDGQFNLHANGFTFNCNYLPCTDTLLFNLLQTLQHSVGKLGLFSRQVLSFPHEFSYGIGRKHSFSLRVSSANPVCVSNVENFGGAMFELFQPNQSIKYCPLTSHRILPA